MSLLHRIFNFWFPQGCPDIPNPPSPPEPAPKLEPSCFARGIAKSIETEPEAWTSQKSIDTNYTASHYLVVIHEKTGIKLMGKFSYPNSCYRWRDFFCSITHRFYNLAILNGDSVIESHGGTDQQIIDLIHIADTIEKHPIGQFKSVIDEEKKAESIRQNAFTHFSNLGCPPIT